MEWALDFESYDDIQHLLANGALKHDSPAYLIARQAVAIGFASFSMRQRQIYDAIIAPALEGLALQERRGGPCPKPPEVRLADVNAFGRSPIAQLFAQQPKPEAASRVALPSLQRSAFLQPDGAGKPSPALSFCRRPGQARRRSEPSAGAATPQHQSNASR
jgi:hypothetical protein